MTIRRAEPRDAEVIAELIRELASYERAAGEVRITLEQIDRVLFGGDRRVFCELVEVGDGSVGGFAVWFLNYSTWTGQYGVYLEDLFVRPEYRGRGYGTALLARLASECVTHGYTRLQWSALDWNTPAIDFYTSLGAEAMSEWTVYRLSGAPLEQLARSSHVEGEPATGG
ncbi:MAG: GNAT family N-acetyltransferase [Acidimicrobiales bacterium]